MPRATDSHPLPPIAIVVSRYNATVTDALRDAAIKDYVDRGGRRKDVVVLETPGSFELTAVCDAAARSGRFAGVVALGCIIKGETSHDRYLAHAVAQGLTRVALDTGVPVALGVLTTDTPGQARERAGGKFGNKGAEAMSAVLDVIAVCAGLGGAKSARIRRTIRDKARPGARTTGRTR